MMDQAQDQIQAEEKDQGTQGQKYDMIEKMLSYDPLASAEVMTGKSYKEDESTSMLGLSLQMAHSEIKKDALMAMDDTTFSNNLERYLRIAKELGFEIALDLPFDSVPIYPNEEVRKEKFFILMHPEKAILLEFDTCDSERVNGGSFYYCVKEKPCMTEEGISKRHRVLSNCSRYCLSDPSRRDYEWDGDDSFVFGHHDCREAMRYNINRLSEYFNFLNPWPKHNGFMWLLHHADTKVEGYDHKAITQSRIELLPENYRKLISR